VKLHTADDATEREVRSLRTCDDEPVDRFDPRHAPSDWAADDLDLLQAVEDATATPIYIEYRLGPAWSEGVDAVIDEIEALVRNRPRVALELVEHTLVRLDRAMLDDSDGWLTRFCQRLTTLHSGAIDSAGVSATEAAERREALDALELQPFDHAG
jgi:hypothetical protein